MSRRLQPVTHGTSGVRGRRIYRAERKNAMRSKTWMILKAKRLALELTRSEYDRQQQFKGPRP